MMGRFFGHAVQGFGGARFLKFALVAGLGGVARRGRVPWFFALAARSVERSRHLAHGAW